MSKMFSTTQTVADTLGISRETLRSWCTVFEKYLSPTARPGQGKRRQFTEDDIAVFATVAQGRNDGMQFEDIGAVLSSGKRVDLSELKAITPRGFENQIVALRQEITELQEQYQKSQVDNAKLQGEIDALTRQLKEAQDKNDRLNREIGALQSKVKE
jgi:DNA-binding transcriptional MerR regulator